MPYVLKLTKNRWPPPPQDAAFRCEGSVLDNRVGARVDVFPGSTRSACRDLSFKPINISSKVLFPFLLLTQELYGHLVLLIKSWASVKMNFNLKKCQIWVSVIFKDFSLFFFACLLLSETKPGFCIRRQSCVDKETHLKQLWSKTPGVSCPMISIFARFTRMHFYVKCAYGIRFL